MSLITIIGRGHSGTRAISHTLLASGVYMGHPLNRSGDLLPPQAMYDACRVCARYVDWQGDLSWSFDQLDNVPIPDEFVGLIDEYLDAVCRSEVLLRGWKIPETTLAFPWIRRLMPETKYIMWVRDPRDCILGRHKTDDLRDFGIDYPQTENEYRRRAISWKYQYDLINAVAKPANWIEVRLEDFVLRQEETLERLEEFLGLPLARIPVRPEVIGRWRDQAKSVNFDFLQPALQQYGYECEKR